MNTLIDWLILLAIIIVPAIIFFGIMGALGAPAWVAFLAWMFLFRN